jgi:hypothetical protein
MGQLFIHSETFWDPKETYKDYDGLKEKKFM